VNGGDGGNISSRYCIHDDDSSSIKRLEQDETRLMAIPSYIKILL
jgi:hypothetical protein